MAFEFQVTFDSADPGALAAFWAEVLHYVPSPPPEGFATWEAAFDASEVPAERRNDSAAIVDPDGVGPRVYIQRVPEPKTAKNRVHLDVRAAPGLEGDARYAALDAEFERVSALGATLFARLEPDGENELCIVMLDPEGNEFCLD